MSAMEWHQPFKSACVCMCVCVCVCVKEHKENIAQKRVCVRACVCAR